MTVGIGWQSLDDNPADRLADVAQPPGDQRQRIRRKRTDQSLLSLGAKKSGTSR